MGATLGRTLFCGSIAARSVIQACQSDRAVFRAAQAQIDANVVLKPLGSLIFQAPKRDLFKVHTEAIPGGTASALDPLRPLF